MVRHRRFLTCLAVLLGCCALPDSTAAQRQNIRQATIVSPHRHGSSNLFAVMGHVRDPQVFELPTASPSLVELVEVFARGLTNTASSNVRIIRNGRSINTFYTENSAERLMPGDLVIVDGKTSGGSVYRGNQSNAASADSSVRIGVIGVLPYPLLIQLNPGDSATATSIAGSLGQSEAAAAQAQFIVPRRFSRTDATTLLPDGSVILFDPSTIDTSRLPQRLPTPVRPRPAAPQAAPQGAAAAQPPLSGSIGAPRPLAQIPYARSLSPSGVASVPSTSPQQLPPNTSAQLAPNPKPGESPAPDQPLRRDAEERVRDRLTSPSSVSVESSGNPLRSAPPPSEGRAPGRVLLNDDTAGTDNDWASPLGSARTGSLRKHSPSPATKPFQSFVDEREASNAKSEDAGTVELTLTPETPSAENHSINPPASPESFGNRLSGANRGDERLTGDGNVPDSPSIISSDREMPFPTDVKSKQAIETRSGSKTRAQEPTAADSNPTRVSIDQRSRVLDAVQKGTVNPRPVRPANWPLISALAIGGGAAFSILVMMVFVAWRKPEPPAPVVPGERFWLDRIIQNEMPIVDEPVELPNGEKLFGTATPIRRLDAAHQSIPKPHFLAAGGESGIRRGSVPPSADPESGTTDSPIDESTTSPETHTSRPDSRPNRSQPAVPLRPAAEHAPVVSSEGPEREATTTSSSGSNGFSLDLTRLPSATRKSRVTSQSSLQNQTAPSSAAETTSGESRRETSTALHGARRSFRIDSGHRPITRAATPAAPDPQTDTATVEQPAEQPPVVDILKPQGNNSQHSTNRHSESETTTESVQPPTHAARMPVPRPRHLARRQASALHEPSVAPSDALAEPQPNASRQDAAGSITTGAVKPQSDITVKPARSVAETADLLDRVLSSVQRERRGGQ